MTLMPTKCARTSIHDWPQRLRTFRARALANNLRQQVVFAEVGHALQSSGMPVTQWEYNNLLRLDCNPLGPPAEEWRRELHDRSAGMVSPSLL